MHKVEFTKKLTKTVIALDGIVQQPITFTPINHSLAYNSFYASNGITAGISTFNISGISSIQPRDLIKIDDEYMKVVEVGLSTNVGGELLGPINGVISSWNAQLSHQFLLLEHLSVVRQLLTKMVQMFSIQEVHSTLLILLYTLLILQEVTLELGEMQVIYHS